MKHELNKHELAAVRAFHKLLAVRTEGWGEMENYDRHWDGGEWSGPAWADNWQEMEHRCEEEIAERFNLPSGEYVMQCVWTYDGIESQHYYDAVIHNVHS